MRYILFALALLLSLHCAAQTQVIRRGDSTYRDGVWFVRVDVAPEAGYDVAAYVMSHLKYPEGRKNADPAGRIVVRFVLNEDGHVSDAEIVRGADTALNRVMIKVVNGMPKWAKPAMRNERAVKVPFVMPFIIHWE